MASKTAENGWLISINSLVRGVFLTFAFPTIISRGRKWLDKRNAAPIVDIDPVESDIPDVLARPEDLVSSVPGVTEPQQYPIQPAQPAAVDQTSFAFDLHFTKYSLLADGILTGLATFTTQGYEMYIIAVILPLASGTGPAAKGTILAMCPASQRADALSAISLVDLVARMVSTGVFGMIFSVFATIGRPNLTFACNAGIAVVGFASLMLARFPPQGSRRFVEGEDDDDDA